MSTLLASLSLNLAEEQQRALTHASGLSGTDGLTAAESRTLEALLDKVVGTLVAGRISERHDDDQPAWWCPCRVCNFTDCGRPEGRCPARNAAAAALAEHPSP